MGGMIAYIGGVTRDGRRGSRRMLRGLLPLIALAACMAVPQVASAAVETQTYRTGSLAVDGYEVQQNIMLAPSPDVNGFITRMEVDIVDGEGNPVPIQRLMLHHIVFANLARPDRTCDEFTDLRQPDLARLRARALLRRRRGAGEDGAPRRLRLPGQGLRRVGRSSTW